MQRDSIFQFCNKTFYFATHSQFYWSFNCISFKSLQSILRHILIFFRRKKVSMTLRHHLACYFQESWPLPQHFLRAMALIKFPLLSEEIS